MSELNKPLPGGTWLLSAILVVPIVWLFASYQNDSEKAAAQQAGSEVLIAQDGFVGAWHDDPGSEELGDANLSLNAENGRYFLSRINGDGSGARFQLARAANTFVKLGDTSGAMYVVTEAGLEIHDDKGYARTALNVK